MAGDDRGMTTREQRRDQLYPELTAAQIDRIRPYGRVERREAGSILFSPGDTETDFVVILSGTLDILVADHDGEERLVVRHGAGMFTGEINMFSDRRNIVIGRIVEAGDMLIVKRPEFRRLIAQDAELSELFMRAFILRRTVLIEEGFGDLVLIGSSNSAATLRLRRFLSRNGNPFRFLDVEVDKAAESALCAFKVPPDAIPIVILRGTEVLHNPSDRELADKLGLSDIALGDDIYDVVVVGAGPSGLAASVYAASEGLRVLTLEAEAWGGQAATSSKIENYLGFPTGISGQALAARGFTQAQKFGARIAVPRTVKSLDCGARPYTLTLDDGTRVRTATVVVASGATYRRLGVPNDRDFEGNGLYFGATQLEAAVCKDTEIAVVGGGNSAGQAAVFLSQHASKVHMLIRRADLSGTMSRYLVERIEAEPAIELHPFTEVVGLSGNGHLDGMVWRNRETGETEERAIRHLFVMIGAEPNAGWLGRGVAIDEKGFILTGSDLRAETLTEAGWTATRPPFLVETTRPGIFAVGDVRSGSVKRVASAVGEGSIAVQFIHRVLAEAGG